MGKFGTQELYYTIGAASGLGNTSGYNSSFTYEGFGYTDFLADSQTTYTVKNQEGKDISVPADSVEDLKDYAKPGDTVHVTHKMSNVKEGKTVTVDENVVISKSVFGDNMLLPVTGTLKTFSDEDTEKKDIQEDIFNEEHVRLSFPVNGSVYIAYDVVLPDQIYEDKDILTEVLIGTKGMSQDAFESNAKVAGNPTLKSGVDKNVPQQTEERYLSDEEIKVGMLGHTYDTSVDLDLSKEQDNLSLSYSIKDSDGNTVSSIPTNKQAIYSVDYTLRDTRIGSNLTTSNSRKIIVSENHAFENGIDIIAQNITVNEAVLKNHKDDLSDFIKDTSRVKASWREDGSEINDIKVDLNGLTSDSLFKEDPYTVMFHATKNGKTASLSINVYVTPDAVAYFEIPSYVNLYDEGGIDKDHAGAKIQFGIKDGIKTSLVFDVTADNDFNIENAARDHAYTVSLYKSATEKYPDAVTAGRADIGTFSNTERKKDIWYNIKKEPYSRYNEYTGTMMFYISARR